MLRNHPNPIPRLSVKPVVKTIGCVRDNLLYLGTWAAKAVQCVGFAHCLVLALTPALRCDVKMELGRKYAACVCVCACTCTRSVTQMRVAPCIPRRESKAPVANGAANNCHIDRLLTNTLYVATLLGIAQSLQYATHSATRSSTLNPLIFNQLSITVSSILFVVIPLSMSTKLSPALLPLVPNNNLQFTKKTGTHKGTLQFSKTLPKHPIHPPSP